MVIFQEIVTFAIVSLIMYQSCMLAYFYYNDCTYQSAIMGCLLAITLLILIMNIEELNDTFKLDTITNDSEIRVKDIDLEKWREEYSHPLLLNSSSEKTAIFNAEVKNLNQVVERYDELNASPGKPPTVRSQVEITTNLPQFNRVTTGPLDLEREIISPPTEESKKEDRIEVQNPFS